MRISCRALDSPSAGVPAIQPSKVLGSLPRLDLSKLNDPETFSDDISILHGAHVGNVRVLLF